jgi:bacillithiol biosynthesis deacetylase BshB1
MSTKINILAIGAHPDDVELGAGGTLALHIKKGFKTAILDLTRGELGTRGNASLRKKEADAAAEILGIEFRENIALKDGLFDNNEESILKIIKVIRQCKPEIIFCNAINDRHPDHGRAAELVSRACYLSGLRKIKTAKQEQWRPKAVYHYIQDYYIRPDFVVDVTAFIPIKMKAIKAYKSQFYDPASSEPETPISGKDFLEFNLSRAAELGRLIGVKYGEGFTIERPIGVNSLSDII